MTGLRVGRTPRSKRLRAAAATRTVTASGAVARSCHCAPASSAASRGALHDRLIVQTCRFRGDAVRAPVSVHFTAIANEKTDGKVQVVAVVTRRRADKQRLQELARSCHEHFNQSSASRRGGSATRVATPSSAGSLRTRSKPGPTTLGLTYPAPRGKRTEASPPTDVAARRITPR